MFDFGLAAFFSRHAFAFLAVKPPHERRDMFVLSRLVTRPPMACCIYHDAMTAIAAGDAQVDVVTGAVEQIV